MDEPQRLTDTQAVIETQAVVDPEAATAAPWNRRRRRAVLAGLTALAVVAGGIAVAAGGGGSEPKPLALMAGTVGDAGGRAETMTGAAPAVAPAIGSAADGRQAYPYGGWGLKFELAGDLPALAGHAPAWRASGPALDRPAVARIAGALGLRGAPEPRDGGWFVEGGDWTLHTFPGGGTWSVNLFRSRFAGQGDGALVPDDAPAGPSLSPAEAERRVRELLDGMGAPAGSWQFETTETEIGVGWACAAPASGPAMSPEELRKLEAEKLRQLDQPSAPVTTAEVSADKPAPDGPVGSCPPPPAPVEGFAVALYPLLDGVRANWPVWHLTLRSDGRVESLYGSWVTFERGDNYKLRGVDSALEELQARPQAPVRRDGGGTDLPADVPVATVDVPLGAADTATAIDTPAAAVSPGPTAGGSTGSAPSRLPLRDDAPPPPAPQVVTITGVDLALMQVPVFEDGRARIHLVPAYRFVGRFDNGSAWETLVIALHPDAIAPPPDMPVTDDLRSGSGGGSTGIGKAVPPLPPGAEPAVVSDPDYSR